MLGVYFLASLITAVILFAGFAASLYFATAAVLVVAAVGLAVLAYGWPLVFRRSGGSFARGLILASGATSLYLFLMVNASVSGQWLLLVIPTALILAFLYFLAVPIARNDMTTQLATITTAVMAATAMSGWLAMSLDTQRGVVGFVAAVSALVASCAVAFPGPRWIWGILGTALGSAVGYATCAYLVPLDWTIGVPVAALAAGVACATLLLFRATAPTKTVGGAAAVAAFAAALVGITVHVVSLMLIATN